MQNLDTYIKNAFEVLGEDNDIIKDEKLKDATYKSYVNSFGASVILMGLDATILIYSDSSKEKDSKDEVLKIKVMKLITKMVYLKLDKESYRKRKISKIEPWKEYKSLYPDHKSKVLDYYTMSATALKLALRTYPVIEEGGNK